MWHGRARVSPGQSLTHFRVGNINTFKGCNLLGGIVAVFSSLPRKSSGENFLLIPRVGSSGAYNIATSLEALFEGPISSLYSLSSYGSASVSHKMAMLAGLRRGRVYLSFSLAHSLLYLIAWIVLTVVGCHVLVCLLALGNVS